MIGKEEVNLYLYTWLYTYKILRNLQKLLELMNELSNNLVNIQKSIVFLYTGNKRLEN